MSNDGIVPRFDSVEATPIKPLIGSNQNPVKGENMKHYIYSRKGGVGTTTIAAAFGANAVGSGQILLVDSSQSGDMHAVLGMSSSPINAVTNVVNVPNAKGDLWLHTGDVNDIDISGYDHVVVDLGVTDEVPTDGYSYLVAANCYLSLRLSVHEKPDVVIVVMDDTRSLQWKDVSAVFASDTGRVVRVSHDPSVARSVDAGLLVARTPRALTRGLEQVMADRQV
jgi:hypothetical protein